MVKRDGAWRVTSSSKGKTGKGNTPPKDDTPPASGSTTLTINKDGFDKLQIYINSDNNENTGESFTHAKGTDYMLEMTDLSLLTDNRSWASRLNKWQNGSWSEIKGDTLDNSIMIDVKSNEIVLNLQNILKDYTSAENISYSIVKRDGAWRVTSSSQGKIGKGSVEKKTLTKAELKALINAYDSIPTQANKEAIENANVSEIRDMSNLFYRHHFDGDLSEWDTSKVTNMHSMFEDSKIASLPESFDTSNVTDMNHMFLRSQITSLPESFDTSKVTNMRGMFQQTQITSLPESFDTSNVTDMHFMFYRSKITSLPESFDISKVTNMNEMFYNSEITTLPESFDTSKVTNMNEMFHNSKITTLPESFDTSKVTNMAGMFWDSKITSLPGSFDTSNVTNMSFMFNHSEITSLPGSFDTSNVTDMYAMFFGTKHFNQDISHWDVSKVTDWSYFNYNSNLQTSHIPAKFR
jgi:surface protein